MTLAQEMFAIVPATGKANISAAQQALLVGKARWLREAALAGIAVAPTICLTRAAWEALQSERTRRDTRLLSHWVATLFRLVGSNAKPPQLVVRTSAEKLTPGLMAARTSLPAPMSPDESVDPRKPLARAIDEAFQSYAAPASWLASSDKSARARQIIVVQAMFEDELVAVLSRDPVTGALGPVAPNGARLPPLPAPVGKIIERLDARAGTALLCLLAIGKGEPQLLSARTVEIAAGAELQAAVDRVDRGAWSEKRAVAAISPARLPQLLHPRLKSDHEIKPLTTGLGVSPGAASGVVVFTAEDATRMRARGRHCILVVTETGPGDIEGMKAATGILTARGGMTSHAGVVARITGKPCVAGVRNLHIDVADLTCRIGERSFRSGDRLTIDGSDGSVYAGALPLSQPHIGGALGRLLNWSDMSRKISVRTNVETVDAARTALSFGAEGIGLARSEHMFFSPERMVALRRMILSEDETDRTKALTGLVDFQTGDYAALFQTMGGRPVNVRLFDPPLHEFLPRSEEDIVETATSLDLDVRALRHRLERLSEVNPMLGHRGVRLAITYPEILEMQMQALMAGVEATTRSQLAPVSVEVMVPFVSAASEVMWIRERVMAIAEQSGILDSGRAQLSFGTMIELPRAALRAGDIAESVDFFSFGTNDLTQTTLGISRDDAPAFLAAYQRKGIYDEDPFVSVDEEGVGELIKMAIARGKAANPALKIGICGEHAGDPASLRFFSTLDIDYVSCSPYRVPVARLALAQER